MAHESFRKDDPYENGNSGHPELEAAVDERPENPCPPERVGGNRGQEHRCEACGERREENHRRGSAGASGPNRGELRLRRRRRRRPRIDGIAASSPLRHERPLPEFGHLPARVCASLRLRLRFRGCGGRGLHDRCRGGRRLNGWWIRRTRWRQRLGRRGLWRRIRGRIGAGSRGLGRRIRPSRDGDERRCCQPGRERDSDDADKDETPPSLFCLRWYAHRLPLSLQAAAEVYHVTTLGGKFLPRPRSTCAQ